MGRGLHPVLQALNDARSLAFGSNGLRGAPRGGLADALNRAQNEWGEELSQLRRDLLQAKQTRDLLAEALRRIDNEALEGAGFAAIDPNEELELHRLVNELRAIARTALAALTPTQAGRTEEETNG